VKIEKSLVFDEAEQSELLTVANWCNEAMGFFTDGGLRAVRVVTVVGARVSWDQLYKAIVAVDKALDGVKAMETSQRFPVDRKARLESNLVVCRAKLSEWALALGEGR